RIRV
ncbi:oligopeptide transport system permease protein oppB, partial [Vibrio parahaemolyticus IDH02640]